MPHEICFTLHPLHSWALGLKSGTILHHMSVQTFNRHLLIQEANMLQFVPLLLHHHQVKPISFSEHPSASLSQGEAQIHALSVGQTEITKSCAFHQNINR